MKTCSKCGETKPRSAFSINRTKADGLYVWCRPCWNEYRRQWNAKNRDKVRSHQQKWREANWNKARESEKTSKRKHGNYSAYNREYYLRRRYDMSLDDYDKMLAGQNGMCAICASTHKLRVDHCHTTGIIRGILCDPCNLVLGKFKDNPERFMRAAAYLTQLR